MLKTKIKQVTGQIQNRTPSQIERLQNRSVWKGESVLMTYCSQKDYFYSVLKKPQRYM